MDELTDLRTALDELAIAILARAQGKITLSPDVSSGAEQISLADQIKAHAAMAAYLKQRAELIPASPVLPPKKEESRFARLRSEFNGNGHEAPRRGRKPKGEGPTDSDPSSAH